MWVLILIAFVLLLLWAFKKNVPNSKNIDEEKITEDTVLRDQQDFENEIQRDGYMNLPDSISRNELYIYNSLMAPWFKELSDKNRYNEEMIKKIRKDWTDYIESLKDRGTYGFLSSEHDDENGGEDPYWDKHVIASKKVFAIEDAFSSLIGKKATEELKRIRNITRFSAFSRRGELAPDGFRFDDEDRLCPVK